MTIIKQSFREGLARSHVGAIAIAVLLFFPLASAIQVFVYPIALLIGDLASRGGFFFSWKDVTPSGVAWTTAIASFVYASICLVVAWLLSRWVYETGPIAALMSYRNRLGKNRA